MATFVLMHGACLGGCAWQRVTPLLRPAGHEVFTPTLTGLRERVHLAHAGIDLDTHIADIVNVLRYEDLHDLTLVGHSRARMVITGVAERVPERLARLIYVDAVVPEDGQSSCDTAPEGAAWRTDDRARATAAGTPTSGRCRSST